MDLEDIRIKKTKLEIDIGKLLISFGMETGVTVDKVDIFLGADLKDERAVVKNVSVRGRI